MKRIVNACLEQTLLFSVREPVSPVADRAAVLEDYDHFKKQMLQKRIKYEILSKDEQENGALRVRVKRQYNAYPCDDYIA